MIFFLPKIGNFQMLLVSKGIHGNQVFQRYLVVQTLLYWNQLKPLAQNCPKNYYLHSSTGVLCSNLAIISILLWFDGKNCTFDRKKVIAFLTTFPRCVSWTCMPFVRPKYNKSFQQLLNQNKQDAQLHIFVKNKSETWSKEIAAEIIIFCAIMESS